MKLSTKKTLRTLRKREEFLAIAKSGRKWVTSGLILQMGRTSTDETAIRFGLTASGKIGNAVIRNRARRRLRALAGEILPAHAICGDYVLIARASTVTRTFPDLRQDLTTALQKLEAWCDKTG